MLYSRLFTSIVSRCSGEYSIAACSPLTVEIFPLWKLTNNIPGSLLLVFWPVIWLAGSWLPNRGSNALPLQRECRVLTTGLPGKSLSFHFSAGHEIFKGTPWPPALIQAFRVCGSLVFPGRECGSVVQFSRGCMCGRCPSPEAVNFPLPFLRLPQWGS